ncbi:MAG: T9SS type A sorting domain-containing protein [Balneola sp.]
MIWLFGTGVSVAQIDRATIPDILIDYKAGNHTAEETYLRMIDAYDDGTIHKCTSPLHIFAHKHKNEISASLIEQNRAVKQKSSAVTYTSASGKFEFTYQTTGDDAVPAPDSNTNNVPDFVEEAAIAADSTYNYLVQTLGFADPIPDGSVYEISFEDLQNTYGFAQTYSNPGGPGTHIVVENDFVGFPSNNDPDGNQLGALRVTVAHEFKHAIQFAQNDFSGDSDGWAEMDATLIEEVVYDLVNDYYNYLGGSGDVFGNPGVSVSPGSYEDITWALYFHEKIGADFWPGVWNRIENSVTDIPFLNAVDAELDSRGLDYTESLLELYAWHFVSGAYSNNAFGFDENMFYPTPNSQRTDTQVQDVLSDDINLGRFASYFLNVKPPSNQTGEASVIIDTESSEISLAVVALFKDETVAFEYAELESGFFVVNEGWKWADIDRLGAIVLNENRGASNTFKIRVSDTFPTTNQFDGTKPEVTELKQNYPNPFNPSTTIPVSISEFQKVKVDIYDITGRLVRSVFNGTLPTGNHTLSVNLEDLASGVYMYRLQTDNKVQIRRMTLVK